MIEQIDRVLTELSRLHGDASRLLDDYARHVRVRDGLDNLSFEYIRQAHVDARAGQSLDLRHALEMARADLLGTTPVNDVPSPPQTFLLDSGVTEAISPRQAALQLKSRRHG